MEKMDELTAYSMQDMLAIEPLLKPNPSLGELLRSKLYDSKTDDSVGTGYGWNFPEPKVSAEQTRWIPYSSGYKSSQMNPRKFTHRAEQLHHALMAFEGNAFDALVCRGTSGLAMASALAVLGGYNYVLIRKGEQSHGQQIEICSDFRDSIAGRDEVRLVFVDDFVASGDTLYECKRALDSGFTTAKIVGVALYACSNRGATVRGYRNFTEGYNFHD